MTLLILALGLLVSFGMIYALRYLDETSTMFDAVVRSKQNGQMLFIRKRSLRFAQAATAEFLIFTVMTLSLLLQPPWRALGFGISLLGLIIFKVIVLAIDRWMVMRRYGL